MKILLADAISELEKLCDDMDAIDLTGTSDDTLTAMRLSLDEKKETLEESVDRRLKYIKYLESQIALAEQEIDAWETRRSRMERIRDSVKSHTLALAKSSTLPLRGRLGSFKVQKNSVPKLSLTSAHLDSRSIVEFIPQTKEIAEALKQYTFEDHVSILDTGELRRDLLKGKEIPGVTLEYGEHLRIGRDAVDGD